jgi:hypothetical protein
METLRFSREEQFGDSKFEFYNLDLAILSEQLERAKLLVVGEMHGVKQNYDVYRFLVEELGIQSVGMEIPENDFSFLKNLDKLAIEDPLVKLKMKLSQYKDGRFSKSLLDFVASLKSANKNLFLFDNGKHNFEKSHEQNAIIRDRAMTRSILDNFTNQKTLVIAGNYHTQREREGSMAHFLSQERDFTTAEINYLSGQYHNFGSKEFKTQGEIESTNIKFEEENNKFKFIVPKAEKVELL